MSDNALIIELLFAAGGGLCPDLLRWLKNRSAFQKALPSNKAIILGLLAQVFLAVLVVGAMSKSGAIHDYLGALIYGYSAPQVLTTLASKKVNKLDNDEVSNESENSINPTLLLRQWWY